MTDTPTPDTFPDGVEQRHREFSNRAYAINTRSGLASLFAEFEATLAPAPGAVGQSLCGRIFDHKWLDPICVEDGCQSLAGRHLMKRLYEVVHHDPDCNSIGGAGDKDCTCDAVPLLRELEAAWRLPVGEQAKTTLTPQTLDGDALRETCVDLAASLSATLSILQRANKEKKRPRFVVASDKMFATMMIDYQKSLDRARATLSAMPATPDDRGAK